MKLIVIPNEYEPVCLKELRKVTNNYSHLQGDCMQETKSTLRVLQMNHCAYCERKLIQFLLNTLYHNLQAQVLSLTIF